MKTTRKAIEFIFNSDIPFEERCSEVYRFQLEKNSVFRRFVEAFGLRQSSSISPEEIPLLPIRAFKDGEIIADSEKKTPDLIFKSSGTSEMNRSTHFISHKKIYETAILTEFEKYFPFQKYTILFFLPGYEENPHSSLIWMAKHLVKNDSSKKSRFLSADVLKALEKSDKNDKKLLLFGAAFGLIDLIESGKVPVVENFEILETGGMKTHRRKVTKSELRTLLADGFQISPEKIHSEYGMCELLSQMYATGGERFNTPNWVQVTIRDPKNPLRICDAGEEGKIGIIDLANVYSCPFILTDDRGVMDTSGRFQVLGRWNSEDMRGCNFLIDRE